MISIKVESNFAKNADVILRKYQVNASRHVNRVLNTFKRDIQLGMKNTPKTGNTYERGGKTHIASSAGNPPAMDTSRLVSSIQIKPSTPSIKPVGKVFTNVEYSQMLELYMDRPFMGKESKAYQQAKAFSKKMSKDIKVK
jgi:hypothetical protein